MSSYISFETFYTAAAFKSKNLTIYPEMPNGEDIGYVLPYNNHFFVSSSIVLKLSVQLVIDVQY